MKPTDKELNKYFEDWHKRGVERFGMNWYLMNRQFVEQANKLGIIPDDNVTKMLLTMCAMVALDFVEVSRKNA